MRVHGQVLASSICRASLSKNANFLLPFLPLARRMLVILIPTCMVDSRSKYFKKLYKKEEKEKQMTLIICSMNHFDFRSHFIRFTRATGCRKDIWKQTRRILELKTLERISPLRILSTCLFLTFTRD